jgi:hypothetical protein
VLLPAAPRSAGARLRPPVESPAAAVLGRDHRRCEVPEGLGANRDHLNEASDLWVHNLVAFARRGGLRMCRDSPAQRAEVKPDAPPTGAAPAPQQSEAPQQAAHPVGAQRRVLRPWHLLRGGRSRAMG